MDEVKFTPEQEAVRDLAGSLGWGAFLSALAEVAGAQADVHVRWQNRDMAQALHLVRRDAAAAAKMFPKAV